MKSAISLLKREVLITNKILREQDRTVYVTNLEKINKHTISNKKLLKGPSACGPGAK